MINVGDNKTFILNGVSPGATPLRYVWKWWDHTVDVTTNGTIAKRVNQGGNPADAFLLRYSVEVVNEIGLSGVYNGSFVVNNPPSIIQGSSVLSDNGQDFSFPVSASLIAYDLESQMMTFNWRAGMVSLGSGSPTLIVAAQKGTYAGTFAGLYAGYQSSVNYVVSSNGSIACDIVDTQGGTTTVVFPLYGQAAETPYTAPISTAASGSIDSATSGNVRIGSNKTADFTVYTPSNSNPTDFRWAYYGTNGWSFTSFSSGTTTLMSDGAFRNTDHKAISSETVGQKTAECRLLDTTTGRSTTVHLGVFLEANQVPVIASTQVLPALPTVGDVLEFSAHASDGDGDSLTYKWVFPGFSPALTLWGRKVYVNSVGFVPGSTVTATLTITDQLGGTATQVVTSGLLS